MRVCAETHCYRLTPVRFCPEHQAARNRAHNARTNERYSNVLYRKGKEQALTRDGHRCRVCRTTKNVQAHHVVPIGIAEAAGWTLEEIHAPANLRSLCDKHNKEADAQYRARGGVAPRSA